MTTYANDTVKEWLGAYLDGELNAARRDWVEEHLATCAGCQSELQALRELSALLQADPQPAAAASSPVFTGQLLRSLPKRGGSRDGLRMPAAGALRWAPLGLFGLWAFIEVVLVVSGAVLWGLGFLQIELPGQNGLLGSLLNSMLPAAGVDPAAAGFVLPGALLLGLELAATVLVAVLFLAWLVGYHSFQQARSRVEILQSN